MKNTPVALLGGITHETFLRKYWQKKPLLVRNAIPGFDGTLNTQTLFELAGSDEIESRLVIHGHKGWSIAHGPFAATAFRKRRDPWSLLVQGVNLFDQKSAALLQHFAFIPYARLDDLMISYATPGGGVGPHFDSYDVFLLQGPGRRRWRISSQCDQILEPDTPLKILSNFRAEEEWILEPGDMLYLPPNYAHEGVALDACFTYSIGFRAPSAQELATGFLVHLQDEVDFKGMYADPDLAIQPPAEISETMLDRVTGMLNAIRWDRTDVEHFLGRYLSEPKANVFFDPPASIPSPARFAQRAVRDGIVLALKTRLFYHGANFFLNGDDFLPPVSMRVILRQLADQRHLPAETRWTENLLTLMRDWYAQGYIEFSPAKRIKKH